MTRTSADGNCLYNACSLALVGDESLAMCLRCLTSIELFTNAEYYASHNVLSEWKSPEVLIYTILSFASIDSCNGDIVSAILEEAVLNTENFKPASFVCILALSSALHQKIDSHFPIEGANVENKNFYECLFNQTVYPREDFSPTNNSIHIFRCALTPHDFVCTGKFPAIKDHYVPLLPQENVKVNEKDICAMRKKPKKLNTCVPTLPVPSFLSELDSTLPPRKEINSVEKPSVKSELPIKKKQLSINHFYSEKPPCILGRKKTQGNEVIMLTSQSSSLDVGNSFIAAAPEKSPSLVQECSTVNNDIGMYYKIARTLTDSQKYDMLCHVWKPSPDFAFPISSSGRRFQIRWMEEFPWLCYSAILDGAFCITCVFFGGDSSHNASKLNYLFKEPFKCWPTAIKRFRDHGTKSPIHTTATLRRSHFTACMENRTTSITLQYDGLVSKQVEINRKKLLPIVEAVILCGRQNIPLRGHRDDASNSDETCNHGNLQAILGYLVKCGNNILFEDHYRNAPQSATYRSKTTQNEIIRICKKQITQKIVAEIRDAKFFSILADEAADVSNCEQLALVIRFVDESSLIRESFLGFFPCNEGLSGKAIAEKIVTAVNDLGLDMTFCRGQGYDGAGNMAGKCNGASTIIKNNYPKALYVHCKSHLLNLCVASSCQLEPVRNMMAHVKSVSDFFNVHPKHFSLLQSQIEKLLPFARHKHLIDVCRTRWVSRIDGLDVFVEVFVSIIGSLDLVKMNADRSWNPKICKEALNLFYSIVSFEFIVSFVMVARVLEVTRPLTKQLQSVSIDVIESTEKLSLLTSMLMRLRTEIDAIHEDWYTEAVKLAGKVGTVPLQPRSIMVQAYRSNTPASSPSEYYKRNLTIPFLDHLTNEVQRRFSKPTVDLLSAFYALPDVVVRDSYWIQKFMNFLHLYEDDLPEPRYLSTELKTWETKWKFTSKELPSKLCDVILEFARSPIGRVLIDSSKHPQKCPQNIKNHLQLRRN